MLPTAHCAKLSHRHWFSRIAAASGAAVTGYVQNLFDEIGIQEYAYNRGWLTEPRRVGIQVRHRPQL